MSDGFLVKSFQLIDPNVFIWHFLVLFNLLVRSMRLFGQKSLQWVLVTIIISNVSICHADSNYKSPKFNDQTNTQAMDRIIFDGKWKVQHFHDIQIPVARAPYPTFGMPWPLPQQWAIRTRFFMINLQEFHIQHIKVKNTILNSAVNRYLQLINDRIGLSTYSQMWKHQESSLTHILLKQNLIPVSFGTGGSDYRYAESSTHEWNKTYIEHFLKLFKESSDFIPQHPYVLKSAKLYVKNPGEPWPHLHMDESYIIAVVREGIYIYANETWGALRALETLSQLLWTTSDRSKVFINETFIHDYPRFKHRGIHIDTARHFISKPILLTNLEAMAYHKLNVFHWHIIDDQSFPFQSQIFPELSEKGAYRKDHIYTHEDIKEIVEFARFRGIRVIPEFDVPGHTKSLSLSHPEIMSKCYTDTTTWSGYYGPLNPISNQTFVFLEKIFEEFFTVFKDHYIHLGGDEVESVCWENNPDLLQDLAQLKIDDVSTMHEYFWRRIQNMVTQIGAKDLSKQRHLIVWQDVLNHVLETKKSLLIHVWSSSAVMPLFQGYDVIFSSCWYLDSVPDLSKWFQFYLCEPSHDAPQLTEHKILGGEACMWTEYQTDESVLLRIWPLSTLFSERMWSDKSVRNTQSVAPRVEEQGCRLINRGIPVSSLFGPGYCDRDPETVVTRKAFRDSQHQSYFYAFNEKRVLIYQHTIINFIFGVIFGIFCVFFCGKFPPFSRHRLSFKANFLFTRKYLVLLIMLAVIFTFACFMLSN